MLLDASEIGSQRPPCRGPRRQAKPFAKSKRGSGSSQVGGGRGRFLHWRIFCRCQEDRSRLGRYDCTLNPLVQEEEACSRLPPLHWSWDAWLGESKLYNSDK